jgi:hypothetical protein
MLIRCSVCPSRRGYGSIKKSRGVGHKKRPELLRSGFYDVDMVNEECQCDDYSFRVSVRRASRKDRTTKPSNSAKSGMSEKLSSEWLIASVTVTR